MPPATAFRKSNSHLVKLNRVMKCFECGMWLKHKMTFSQYLIFSAGISINLYYIVASCRMCGAIYFTSVLSLESGLGEGFVLTPKRGHGHMTLQNTYIGK